MSCCSYFDHTAETKGEEERSPPDRSRHLLNGRRVKDGRGDVLVPERRLRLALPSRTLAPQGRCVWSGPDGRRGRSLSCRSERESGARREFLSDWSTRSVMSSVKVECVVEAGALIGEGPVWEESEQTLLFVDIGGQKIHRWNSVTNQIQSVETGDAVGFVVPRSSGGYVAGVGRSMVAVDWPTPPVTSLVEVDEDKPNNRLNDGKVDPVGRLLAGTMGREARPAVVQKHQGSLFSVSSDLTVTKHLDQVDISNGMDWSSDRRTFFYIDSLSLTVDALDYDVTTGKMGNRRVVYHVEEGEGLPDGMTIDVNGRLWVACYNAGRVINIDPATGVRLQTVSLPVTKTTSCCFGGPDYSDLYVTSASLGLDQSERWKQPLAGNTFRVTGLGVKGRPSTSFAG